MNNFSVRVRQSILGSVVGGGLLFGCSSREAVPPASPAESGHAASNAEATSVEVKDELGELRAAASRGVVSPKLRALLEEHWEWTLSVSPTWATSLGYRMHDARLSKTDRESTVLNRETQHRYLERASALQASTKLSVSDARTLSLFVGWLSASAASEVCEFSAWSLSAMRNVVTVYNRLPDLHDVKTLEDANNLLARYAAVAAAIDGQLAHYAWGLEQNLVANAESIRRALTLARKQLAQPIAEWPLLHPLKPEHSDWPAEERRRFREQIKTLVETSIAPAYERYADFLERKLLPKARGEGAVGIGALPSGAACYQARAAWYTSLPDSPTRLHEIGQAELSKINDAMRELGAKALGEPTLEGTLKRLRSDPALFFSSKDQILKTAKSAMKRAEQAIPESFGRLPQAKSVVVQVPDYEAPFTTIAYYRPPVPDGSKPGRYFVNLDRPETRPRYTAEVLAFHEAIPGHHLQIAISQELEETPAFRRHIGVTAFVEGWALYTERLADEMGLYSGDLDRLGMLNFDAWRAARLVVDTGLHAQGWTRAQAEAFLLKHTALSENNIENEVDRYITWPGQALAYKMGQLKILELRQRAERGLGAGFKLSKFHDLILSEGAVNLSLLERMVCDWMRSEGASCEATSQ